jgi:hypothetical protein
MAALQVIGVALALVAVAALALSARMLGDEAKGWREASFQYIAGLDLLALFWLVAAFVGARSKAVITVPSVLFAAAFALGGLLLLAWIWRHRPARARGSERNG